MITEIRRWLTVTFCCLSLMCNGRDITHIALPTASAGNDRPVLIYTPTNYDVTTDSLPVLYLLHGIDGDENSWQQNGRIVEILDSLIGNEIIKPLIVVMPNVNMGNPIWRHGDYTTLRVLLRYGKIKRQHFEDYFLEIQHYIDTHYRISKLQQDHYIAGISHGAMQVAQIIDKYPDYFSYAGFFSPVIDKKVPVSCAQWSAWVGIAKADFFKPNGKRFCRKLEKAGIPYTLYITKGGHTWRSWQEDIKAFLCHIACGR